MTVGRAAIPGQDTASQGKAVTFRSVLLCLLLLPINAYWVIQMEFVRYSAHPTTISIFFNTIFILLCLTLLNRLIRRWAPRAALNQGELLLVYAVLSVGSCVAGHDMMQLLVPMLTYSFKHATTANGWNTLINAHLPPALFVSDESIYAGYYYGHDSVWHMRYIRAWMPVVLVWTLFISTLLFVMLCINAILRKQWTEVERLTYPVIQLPLQITSEQAFESEGLFKNRLFWIAFAIAAGIDTINSLNYYYPSIPTILTPGAGQSYLDIGPLFTSKPWNAIGWTPLSFYPFVIGLGILMPLDFLFSSFFFYWFWKMERVVSVALAFDQTTRFPYVENQSFGAYLSFCVFAVWTSRGYLKRVWDRAWNEPSDLDDTNEPMTYRAALLGILAGVGLLAAFSAWLGLAWWIAIVFFLMYFALAVAITRMRAELGTPVHDLHFTGPQMILTRVLGSQSFDSQSLTVFAMFNWFNRAYRGHPMPHQLEAYKLAEQTGGEYRRWHWAMLLLGAAAVFIAFWVFLHLMYSYGAEGQVIGRFGAESFDQLTAWLKLPARGSGAEFNAILIGFGIAFLLQWLRIRLPWWPFHPLAFAVASSWEINLVWLPLFIAWMLKSMILRYGGGQGFRRALPFFFGLMLGQFVAGSVWNILGISLGLPTYQFWQ